MDVTWTGIGSGGSGFTVSYGSDLNGNPQEITTGGVHQAYSYDSG